MSAPGPWLEALEDRAARRLDEMLASNAFLKGFHEGTETNPGLYRRHILETAIRIRMNNEVDSHALTRAIKGDRIAEHLLSYLQEEYGHDRMFEEDLRAMGMSEQELEEAKPLFSTELLMAYLWKAVEEDGMLPALLWDWLVEWYSARYNARITETAAGVVGPESVRQTTRHLELDEELEHEDGLTHALTALIEREHSLWKAEQYLDRFVQLIEMYFRELLSEFDL